MTERGASRTRGDGRPPLPQYVREWVRMKVGTALARPFWAVSDLGQWADRHGTRILVWSERASQKAERSEP